MQLRSAAMTHCLYSHRLCSPPRSWLWVPPAVFLKGSCVAPKGNFDLAFFQTRDFLILESFQNGLEVVWFQFLPFKSGPSKEVIRENLLRPSPGLISLMH